MSNDVTRNDALTLESGENQLWSAIIDSDGTFGYFGTSTSPGRVVKVQLSDMTRVSAVTLESGENQLYSAIIDSDGVYGYFGTRTSPGIVVKVNTGESVASSSGDPHIYPFFGNKYELPMKQTAYRMLQGEKLILNASTSYTTPEEQKTIQSYYKRVTGEDAPQNLITDGIFYNNVFLKSDGHTMNYNFKTQKGNASSEYFSIQQQSVDKKQMNKYEKSEYIQQISIAFTHSVYGKMTLNLNYFSNPQIKYGMSVKVQHKEGLTGLLVREYKCKTMECHQLRKTKKLVGKIGNNKVNSVFNV